MFNTDYLTVLQLHRQRHRADEQRRIEHDLLRVALEPSASPNPSDLLRDIRQWMQLRNEQQEARNVRHAPAL